MSKRQPDLFEPKKAPNDSQGVIDPKAELCTDGSFRVPGSGQERLAFSIPFAETRSMRMQSAECRERSRRECEQFEDNFSEPEDDSSAD